VIESLIDAVEVRGISYQTVRCPFEEGEQVYHGGMIRDQSHIQIAVRDKSCISSRIYLVNPVEAARDKTRIG
jgi:hypothetical protein